MSDQTDNTRDKSPFALQALNPGDRQLLQQLAQSSSDGIVAFDREFRYIVWNEAMERLTGMSRRETLGRSIFDLFPTLLETPDGESLKATLDGQASKVHEGYFLISATGCEAFYEAHYFPLRSAQNEIVGGLGIVRDLTQHRRSKAEHEELLHQQISDAQLENAERHFRSLFAHSPLSMQILALDGRTLRVNKAWETLWGLTLEDVANYNVLEDPQLVEKGIMPFIKQGFAGEAAFIPAIYYEPDLNVEDSHARWVEGFVYPLTDEADNITELVLCHRDVSDRQKVEDLLHERARHAALRADVSVALGQELVLHEALQKCTQAMVQHLDAAFARIWILDHDESTLRLRASAGMYTHLDGEHSRIAIGQHKIGAVAAERKPILTNDIVQSPRLTDREWARREGMVSFAGYPLIVDNEVIGVMAMFSRYRLTHDVLDALSTVADVIAQGIQRSRIEDELRESGARYRALFDTNPAPALVYDEKTVQILAVNQAAIEHYGYSGDEFLQLTMKDIRPPEDVPAFMARLASLTPSTRQVGVWRHCKKNGSVIHVEIKTSPLVFEGRRARITIINDVTQRKRIEESQQMLAKAGAILGSSLDHQATLQSVAQLAVPFLADWCVVDMFEGSTIRRLAIAHVDPAKEKLGWEMDKHYPADAEEANGPANVRRTGQPEMADIPDELLQQGARDAEHLNFLRAMGLKSYMCVPMHTRGRTLGAITFIWAESGHSYTPDDLHLAQDLAARAANAVDNARLYHEAQQAREEAEGANRAKDEFLAVVSHELRTPLNAILGWATMLRGGLIDAATSTTALETIERNARAQAQLIDDILDVSRIITGKMHLELHTVMIREVIEAATATVRPAAEAKDIRLYLSLNAFAQPIQGDAVRLQQVVWNLLMNAIKFTPLGGCIEVQLEQSDGWQQVVVKDNGEGIDPRFLPHVFERFRQSDSSSRRQHGGLGLGLALVRHIVEMHGGHADATSEGIGKGATFRVCLPLHKSATAPSSFNSAQPPHNATHAMPGTARPGTLQKQRVLVVDDDAESRALLSTLLKLEGAIVTSVDSAAEALRVLTQNGTDILLSDIGMPHQDGYWLIDKVRTATSPARHICAIALTAYARPEDQQRALAAGFDHFMAKPVEPDALLQLLTNSVTQH
ncbi:MAG TPA: PAS domain S-box protein [Abditibacteriaceae bacterium]|jgi:PAS domain S-box-containing protein